MLENNGAHTKWYDPKMRPISLSPFLRTMVSHQVKHAQRSVRAEAEKKIAGGFLSGGFAARKAGCFVGGERGFSVVRVGKNGFRQICRVKHGEIGTLASERRHQVSSIPNQGYAWDAFPAVTNGQCVDAMS